MVTKDQERAALEHIRKIVASLGEDSYIATAFDGAFELAEENIENDWGSSCAWYVRNYRSKDDQILQIKSDAESVERRLNEVIKELEGQISGLKGELATAIGNCGTLNCTAGNLESELLAERCKAADLELAVTRLKAKLFDLMHPDF